ncbi:MAG: type I glutamate--ammonia ligase [Candidatus Latescibacteria bacterium]|nr:type I glutamate--ammonia ligase [Candidatus Latescibacterota bacterium]
MCSIHPLSQQGGGYPVTPKDVIAFAKENNVQMVDFRFIDLPGIWQHFTTTVDELDESTFEDGVGFDGSSIRGFQTIDKSDMLLIPDPNSAQLDPFTAVPTLLLVCNVKDPVTLEMYTRDARYVAQKAEAYLKSSGLADVAYFGPEAEFYIFDDIRFDQNQHSGYYYVDSSEGFWNSGREESPNLGYKIRYKQGYFPVPPMDQYQDLRTEMVLTLKRMGVQVEVHHHEVGTGGQAEIDIRYDTLAKMGDDLMLYKYVIRNIAHRHGKTVTFMPKPLFQDNGSGMHVHISLWKNKKNLFFEAGRYADISTMARHFIGGLLRHSASILAFAAPTTNSYRRLVPGYEAPINLIYSQRNRSACVRIPMYSKSEKAKRIEYRSPDASSNPYLAFSALLMAGLDGVQNRIEPPDPIDLDLYDLEPEQAAEVKNTPGSLDEALNALEQNHEFLLKGDVFTDDLIRTWIDYKRINEVDAIRLRPHPWEFALYFDI